MNFTNLATARATQRAREVALRKVLGARRQPADRPVHRREFADRGDRDADRARHRRDRGAPWLNAISSMRGPALRTISVPTGCCCRLLALLAGRRRGRRRLSRFLPVAASSRRAVLKANKSAADDDRQRPAAHLAGGRPSSRCRSALIICTAVIYAQTVYAAQRRSRLSTRRPAPGHECVARHARVGP